MKYHEPCLIQNQVWISWPKRQRVLEMERVWKFTVWKSEIYNQEWLALTAGDSERDDLIINRVDWMEHLDGNPFEDISSFQAKISKFTFCMD